EEAPTAAPALGHAQHGGGQAAPTSRGSKRRGEGTSLVGGSPGDQLPEAVPVRCAFEDVWEQHAPPRRQNAEALDRAAQRMVLPTCQQLVEGDVAREHSRERRDGSYIVFVQPAGHVDQSTMLDDIGVIAPLEKGTFEI